MCDGCGGGVFSTGSNPLQTLDEIGLDLLDHLQLPPQASLTHSASSSSQTIRASSFHLLQSQDNHGEPLVRPSTSLPPPLLPSFAADHLLSNRSVSEPIGEGRILLKTTFGNIEIELWPKEAPKACRKSVHPLPFPFLFLEQETDGCCVVWCW